MTADAAGRDHHRVPPQSGPAARGGIAAGERA